MRQIVALTRSAEQLLDEFRARYQTAVSLVLAGDYNIGPNSAHYEYLLHGFLPSDDDVVRRCVAGGCSGVLNDADGTSHGLGLSSAYRTVLGHEPHATNFKPNFRETLEFRLLVTTYNFIGLLHQ